MGKRGRPRKTREQKLTDALSRTSPADHILATRKLFSFVQKPAEKRLDGRNGEIDSEVCDALGQMCALGLLDGHGHDPIELRDKGRFWGCHYARLMKRSGMKMGAHERASQTTHDANALTAADMLFDKMDSNLPSYERSVLLSLIAAPLIGSYPMGEEMAPWAQALIGEALLKRGRIVRMVRFPDAMDRARLDAAVRGLCVLVDGALLSRWAA